MNSMGTKDWWEHLDAYCDPIDRMFLKGKLVLEDGMTLRAGDQFSFTTPEKRVRGTRYIKDTFEIHYVDLGRGYVLCFDVKAMNEYGHKQGHTDLTAYSFSELGLNWHVRQGTIMKNGPDILSGPLHRTVSSPQNQSGRLIKQGQDNKLNGQSQGKFAKYKESLRFPKGLRADNPGQPEPDFEWPERPKFPADPIGPQVDLFEEDDLDKLFEGE